MRGAALAPVLAAAAVAAAVQAWSSQQRATIARRLAVRGGGSRVDEAGRRTLASPSPAALRRELPLAVELLRVAVSAGATPVHAVELVASSGPAAPAAVLGYVVRSLDLGRSFSESLEALDAFPDVAPLAQALRDAGTLGVPVEALLGRLAGELRVELRRNAEARARTVPVRLLFPLVFLVLPAFALLGLAPPLLAGLAG